MAFFGGWFCILAACFVLVCHVVSAKEFTVGDEDGWAQRLRCHVGDSFLFEYSVLQLTQKAFHKCNTATPVASYDDGHMAVKFLKSGTLNFISGAQGHCEKGQKIVVVVMSHGGRRGRGHAINNSFRIVRQLQSCVGYVPHPCPPPPRMTKR